MIKYQQPEMEFIESEVIDIITDSNLSQPENNTGGNEGQLGWEHL